MSQKRLWQDIAPAIFITAVALGPRLFGLDIFLTADEPKSWFGRSIQFLDAVARGDWTATFDSPAPGVTTMWAGSIGLLLEYARQGFPGDLPHFLARVPFDPLDPAILPLIRLPVVLLAVLAAALTYLWGRPVLGQAGALLTALLLALDPFLLSLTRILGHDGLVTLFMWLSLLAFLRATAAPAENRRFVIISGAMGGLAFLSKYPSLFLGAFVALSLLLLYLRRPGSWSQRLRAWLIDLTLWSAAAGLVCVLLWPVMWVDPLGRTMAIIGDALRASGSPHPKGSFFFGQPVPDPGPSYYLWVTLFKTTPVLWLGWLLALVLPLIKPRDQGRPLFVKASLILLAFVLLFGLLVTMGGKKQDRYILPVFPALAALAALGYVQLMRTPPLQGGRADPSPNPSPSGRGILAPPFPRREGGWGVRWAGYWLIPALVIVQAITVWPYHPYYFTYYTPALGGGPAAARLMIVGWGEGLDQAARWLNGQPDAESLDVVAWYSTTFEPFFEGNAIYEIDEEKISRTPKPGLAADYVIFYINQAQRELPTAGTLQFFRAVPPVHTVILNGLEYVWIYPSVKMQQVIGNEARLVGQAELLGFNLLSKTGQPLSSIPADQAALLQLYWEWQGKSPDEPIGLSLIDQTGQTWGRGKPLDTQARFPFEQWQDGMIAHDDFIIEIFPGTPPGDYFLKAWIDRPATGERVGTFPVVLEDVLVSVERPERPFPAATLPLSVQLDASLAGGRLELLGLQHGDEFATPWQPGEEREVVLFWQASQTVSQNYPISLALVDKNGTRRAEWTGLPAGGRFPSDQWQAGDLIRDPWRLSLPAYTPPDDYRFTAQIGAMPAVELRAVTVGGRPRLFEPPPLDLVLNARFGEKIELLGLRQLPFEAITLTPGRPLTLHPVWYTTGLIEADYTLTIQLLDSQQQVRAQQDGMPLDGAAPTSSWAGGEVVPDTISLDIPPEIGPGPHHLLIAFYRLETGERLHLPNAADHLELPVKTTMGE
jgi:hypothetical protein